MDHEPTPDNISADVLVAKPSRRLGCRRCVALFCLFAGCGVGLSVLVIVLLFVLLSPSAGRYELVFTNATDRVIAEASVAIRNHRVEFTNFAPQAATVLVFKASSDTSYQISFRAEGQPTVHTSVGYLCAGINAREKIVIHDNNTLSFSPNSEKYDGKVK